MIKKVIALIFSLLLICSSMSLAGCQKEPVDRIREQLEEDFSFNISLEYMNIAVSGISQKTEQKYGKDGSFYFSVDRRIWDHTNEYDETEKNEFYYQYEDNILYCYMKNSDSEISKEAISKSTLEAMNADKMKIVGSSYLLPSYLESFTEVSEGQKYQFSLSVENALKDSAFLSTYLNNVFALSGKEYDKSLGLNILCTVETEKGTYRPIKISYDFAELKPYVLSDFALDGEAALDTDLMYLIYEFDYNLPEHIEIPSEFQK